MPAVLLHRRPEGGLHLSHHKTLIVNLYGGPGTSKSTTAAYLFARLKERGVTCELVTEYAKDLTWEGRSDALKCQPLVLGKQLYRIERLIGKVDIVITDSPVLLCQVYGAGWGENFRSFVHDVHCRFNTLDVFLARNTEIHPYVPLGRNQTEDQARGLDYAILQMLEGNVTDYARVPVNSLDQTAATILSLIAERMPCGHEARPGGDFCNEYECCRCHPYEDWTGCDCGCGEDACCACGHDGKEG